MLQGLLPFDKACIGPDIIAGITLAALGIPEVMGYTKIIGSGDHRPLYPISASPDVRRIWLIVPSRRGR